MVKPQNWRTGQTIFNFLEWLSKEKKFPVNQSLRMADPFYLTDKEWDKLYKEYVLEMIEKYDNTKKN